jgi:ABC-type multidrug transport system ATPase subunit
VAGLLGVAPGLDEPAGTLSRGNLVKVGLVQLLLSGAGLLVLDEPYAALDPAGASALRRLLAHRAAAGAMVVEAAPHTEASAQRLGPATYRIEGSALVPDRGPADAAERAAREAARPVRVVLMRNGETVARRLRPDQVDDALRAALAVGWSVHEVTAEQEGGQ